MLHDAFTVRSTAREQLVDITDAVERCLVGWGEGVVTVFTAHTTAGITINENADPAVQTDLLSWLRRLVPRDAGFAHAEGNSDAHIKASLIGASVQVPRIGGKLGLGRWQGIYFCEFDGPRERTVTVTLT